MRGPLAAAALTALLASLPVDAPAQVLRELEPVQLEYRILWGDPQEPVGRMEISFSPVETQRGRRLQVEESTHYILPRDIPFEYEETAKLVCDEEGVVRFDTSARALGKERTNVAVRMGEDYHVTTTFEGKKQSKTITSHVQRTNLGMFAGGFLEEKLNEGDLLRDYPMLYPVGGDHEARQKYREAVMPFVLSPERSVSAIVTRVKRKDERSYRLWNAIGGHQILLRMEAPGN
ncbi:MAG TPA: hypothetical protein VKU85_13790, partial [bacterium]|nr:hypothetical protein [bacterium]